jgi:hypothetical protein
MLLYACKNTNIDKYANSIDVLINSFIRRKNPKKFKLPVYVGMIILYIGIGLSIYTIEFQQQHVTLLKNQPVHPDWEWFVALAAITSLFWNVGFALVETASKYNTYMESSSCDVYMVDRRFYTTYIYVPVWTYIHTDIDDVV